MIASRPSTHRRLNEPLRAQRWTACLAASAALLAQPARAQLDTFGGNPDSSAFIRIPKDTDDWTRHFRLGALVGLNISANFSENGHFGSSPGAGYFSNGYVLPDATGDKNYTSNWGYNNASQLNGSTLNMTGVNTYSTSGSSQTGGEAFPGLDLAYGGNLWYWKHARVGWEMGFGWLPITISSSQSSIAEVSQTSYAFNTGSITVPNAPYTGNPNGTGPLIPLNSTSSPLPPSAELLNGTHELDVNLYTLRLGPSFYWDVAEKVGVSIGAGPAVGVVSGNYNYNETLQTGSGAVHYSGQVNGTEFTFGGYVNATLMYHLVNNGDIYIGAQFMPMQNTTISGGGRSGELNLDGQVYLSVGINWPF